MKNLTQLALTLTTSALISHGVVADQLAFYGDGTLEDGDAEANLAAPVANITVSDFDSFGVLAGTLDTGDDTGGDSSRITRPSFATPSPVGPTAGSASGSEWFELRSRENQGTPTSVDNYFFFTVTADPGLTFDLDVLKYDLWVSDGVGSGAIVDAETFVSVDGGAFSSYGSITASDTDGDTNTAAPVSTANIDLSSITGAQSVEVRISVGYSQGNSNGISGFLQGVQLESATGGPALPGDTDGDGDVDDADLGVAFSNYTGPLAPNTGGKTAADGDADGDGDVDDADLGAAFAAYTGPLATAAVPEPTSLALLGLGGLLAARRRRA